MFFHWALLTTVDDVADMSEDMMAAGGDEGGGDGMGDGRMRELGSASVTSPARSSRLRLGLLRSLACSLALPSSPCVRQRQRACACVPERRRHMGGQVPEDEPTLPRRRRALAGLCWESVSAWQHAAPHPALHIPHPCASLPRTLGPSNARRTLGRSPRTLQRPRAPSRCVRWIRFEGASDDGDGTFKVGPALKGDSAWRVRSSVQFFKKDSHHVELGAGTRAY